MKIARFVCRLLRRMMAKGDKKKAKKDNIVPPEGSILDVDYGTNGNPSQRFDVLRAPKSRNKLLIHFHGGSYVGGDKKYVYPFAEVYLKRGYDVCLPNYRVVNEKTKVSVLDQIHDCVDFINFLNSNLEKYGLNGKDIVIGGDSAGGHLALLIQEMIDDPELQKEWGMNCENIKSKCLVLSCPVYDFKGLLTSKILTKKEKKFVFGEACLDEGFADKTCPKRHFSSLKTPVFLSTCINDFLNGKGFYESDKLKKDLEESHQMFGFMNIESNAEGVGHVHNINYPDLDESRQVNEAALSFIDECL